MVHVDVFFTGPYYPANVAIYGYVTLFFAAAFWFPSVLAHVPFPGSSALYHLYSSPATGTISFVSRGRAATDI